MGKLFVIAMYESFLTESQQDYLKIINRLVMNHKVARVKEIAGEKGVSMPTVTEAMKKLAGDGWIIYESRGYIDLTPKGKKAANYFSRRSDFIRNFLHDVLGASVKQAEVEACTLEHHLSDQSIKRLGLLYQFLNHCPKVEPNLLSLFKDCVVSNPDQKDYFCIADIYPHTEQNKTHLLLQNLNPGQTATILLISSEKKIRNFFFKNGLLPGLKLTMKAITENHLIVDYKNQEIYIPKAYGKQIEVSLKERGKA